MFHTTMGNDIREALGHFQRTVDQLFEGFYGYPALTAETPVSGDKAVEARHVAFAPAVEMFWTEHALFLRTILPGVNEKDVHVMLQGRQLLIEGERKAPAFAARETYTRLPYGRFHASVSLPTGLLLDKLACKMENGVLEMEIPLEEAVKPRQIPIRFVEPAKVEAPKPMPT